MVIFYSFLVESGTTLMLPSESRLISKTLFSNIVLSKVSGSRRRAMRNVVTTPWVPSNTFHFNGKDDSFANIGSWSGLFLVYFGLVNSKKTSCARGGSREARNDNHFYWS